MKRGGPSHPNYAEGGHPSSDRPKIGDPYSPHRRFLCAPVPLALMKSPNLSAGAKLLFGRLALHAGKELYCYPGLDTLADELGVSDDTIGRWMAELIGNKFIKRKRCGPGRNAECIFIWNPELGGSDDSTETRNQDSAKVRDQNQSDSAESQNLDSAGRRDEIPQNRGDDSAEMRSAYKEQAVHEAVQVNGSPASLAFRTFTSSDDGDSDAEVAYVNAIKAKWCELPICGPWSDANNRLAQRLHREAVTVGRIADAMTWGAAMRLKAAKNNGASGKIMSLTYFVNSLNDGGFQSTSAAQIEYIRRWLKREFGRETAGAA